MKWIAIMLFVIILTLGVSYGMHVHTLSIFAKNDVGATYDDIAAIGIAKFLPYVLVPLFIGVLLSKLNNGYILAAGVLLHAIPLFLVSTAETIMEILLYQFAIGAAHAFIVPPINAIFSTEPKTRVKNIARSVMFFLVGLMVGPLIGMGIMEATGENYRLLFQIAAVVMTSSLILTMLLRTRLPDVNHAPVDIRAFGMIFHFPVVVAMVLFTTMVSGVLFVVYPVFLTNHGIDATAVSLLYFIHGAFKVGSMLFVNNLHKWMTPFLTLCIGLTTAGLAVSLFGTSVVHFAVAIAMMSFGVAAYPICLEVILARTRRNIANKMVGAFASLVGIGWFLGPAIAGYVAHRFGGDAPYWIFLVMGVGMTVAAVTMHKTLAAVESRYKQSVDANQLLRHDFNIVLMNAGLMNKVLARAKAYEDVPAAIKTQYANLDKIFVQIDNTLDKTDMPDPTLADDIRSLTSEIKGIDLAAGVGDGYPNYDKIKDSINECVRRLDEAVKIDIMLDMRHWVSGRNRGSEQPK